MRLDENGSRGATRTPSALVLLAGSGRPTEFTGEIARPVLDMPLTGSLSIFGHWCLQAEELSSLLGGDPLPVRLLVDSESQTPKIPELSPAIELEVVKDPFEYRGTAGVLSDLAGEYEDDEVLLTANATQLNFLSLAEQYRLIAGATAGVALVAPQDGTPASVMLVRCESLREVPEVGFHDLKEQALSGIAEKLGVDVARAEHPLSFPLRTLESYVKSLREHRRQAEASAAPAVNPYEEVWQSRFSIVEQGGEVAESARVHDSVVLSGGVLERDSIAVRSVVCPGGRVRRGDVVIDEIVTASAGGRTRAGNKGRKRG